MNKAYQSLKKASHEASLLGSIMQLIEWDQETHMPKAAAPFRGEQAHLLAGLIHKKKTSKTIEYALAKLIDFNSGKLLATDLSPAQKVAVKQWRRDFIRDTALPTAFVQQEAKLVSESIEVWRRAKEANNFSLFAPFLEQLFELNRKKAHYINPKANPYDALLNLYEPGVSTRIITPLFSDLRTQLQKIVKKLPRQPNDSFLFGKFSHSKQLAFSKILLEAIDFDFDRGQLDLAVHPFCSSMHPSDTRLTTHIHPTSLMSNVLSTLHEGGHALYGMGLPSEEYGTPLGQAISFGIHESQSRWYETRIGLSRPFWQHFLPQLKKHFPKLKNISLDRFWKGINKVEPSMIRTEADELTYSLHIILRYELEIALIEGKLSAFDIPQAWNEKMTELLGITPKNDAEGCLQDIHWAIAAIGYFPTYTLGNVYAAQIFETFSKEYPEWENRVAKGELFFIKEWLHNQIHQHGRRYDALPLIKKITGKTLSAKPYISYLTQKYAHSK
ncbi:MAG: carboxypeptidase M32 [Chlamydiia bacterium]|nr:carboxypeptidase M32 [Chlamydiia bacterium]